jgi:hypothetical protein
MACKLYVDAYHVLLIACNRQTSTVYRRISIVNAPVLPGVDRGVAVLPPSKL